MCVYMSAYVYCVQKNYSAFACNYLTDDALNHFLNICVVFLNKRREGSFPYTLLLEDLSVHADGSRATHVTTIRYMGIC